MEIVQVNSIKAWLLAARPKTLAGDQNSTPPPPPKNLGGTRHSGFTGMCLGLCRQRLPNDTSIALLCLRFSDADRRQLH